MEFKRQTTFIKINTTGFDPVNDRIVEIYMLRYTPQENGVMLRDSGIRRFNPGFLMSSECISINGITNEDLANECKFCEKAEKIFSFIGNSDIVGFGIKNFDFQFLKNEFLRCGIEFNMNGRLIIDLLELYMSMEPRNFENACSFYLNTKIEKSIGILEKVELFPHIIESMFNKYEDRVKTPEDACRITYNGNIPVDSDGFITKIDDGSYVFNVGKYRGRLIGQTCIDDSNYFNWIIHKSGFSKETKDLIMKITIDYKSSIDESFKNEIKKQEYNI